MNGTRSKTAGCRSKNLTPLQLENKVIEIEEIAKQSEKWDADMNGVINEQGERLQQVEARLQRVEARLQQVEATLRLAGGCCLDVPLMIEGFNTIIEGMNKLQRAQGGVEGAGVEALKGNVGNLIDFQHDRPSASPPTGPSTTFEKGKGQGKGQGKGKGKEREKRPREDEEEDVADAGTQAGPSQKRSKM